MTLPFALPDWLPWWVPLVLLIPALLYALAFLFMPFSVIGMKGRLDVLEARLDEIQNEIRHLALRLPEPGQAVDYDEIYHPEPAAPSRPTPIVTRPPIPPAAHELAHGDAAADRPPPPPHTRPARREPRLDWPR
ncbi:MAG TPA: hypothetical protein VND19_23305 [Acetobacteraceae bacterium]|nr:hypothetical protein [Acetobacteraceae bacterium]